ncbi:hypothetical protein J2S54_006795 [Streptomyces sp. DSM 42143]|nr:hypothetical protein [Streptomyces sp. DSM 42143]
MRGPDCRNGRVAKVPEGWLCSKCACLWEHWERTQRKWATQR